MENNISRRSFLKGSVAAACSIAVSGITENAAADDTAKQLATLFDIRKCIGCGSCVEACKQASVDKYPVPKKPFPKMYPSTVKVEDWSEKQDVIDRFTPYNFLYIQQANLTYDKKQYSLTIPRRCMHCVNPPCVKLCPWGAAKQYPNGISQIDKTICLGGAKCQNVCPWQVPQRQTGAGLYLDIMPSYGGNGIMTKCDRCYNLVIKGQNPACIESCPESVQTIGPRDEILKQAHALAKEINGYIYGEIENGGTNTLYVSPVPFDIINKAIDKGSGHAHFNKVADTMADANNLLTAIVIAPFAGVAAAVGKYMISGSGGDK